MKFNRSIKFAAVGFSAIACSKLALGSAFTIPSLLLTAQLQFISPLSALNQHQDTAANNVVTNAPIRELVAGITSINNSAREIDIGPLTMKDRHNSTTSVYMDQDTGKIHRLIYNERGQLIQTNIFAEEHSNWILKNILAGGIGRTIPGESDLETYLKYLTREIDIHNEDAEGINLTNLNSLAKRLHRLNYDNVPEMEGIALKAIIRSIQYRQDLDLIAISELVDAHNLTRTLSDLVSDEIGIHLENYIEKEYQKIQAGFLSIKPEKRQYYLDNPSVRRMCSDCVWTQFPVDKRKLEESVLALFVKKLQNFQEQSLIINAFHYTVKNLPKSKIETTYHDAMTLDEFFVRNRLVFTLEEPETIKARKNRYFQSFSPDLDSSSELKKFGGAGKWAFFASPHSSDVNKTPEDWTDGKTKVMLFPRADMDTDERDHPTWYYMWMTKYGVDAGTSRKVFLGNFAGFQTDYYGEWIRDYLNEGIGSMRFRQFMEKMENETSADNFEFLERK